MDCIRESVRGVGQCVVCVCYGISQVCASGLFCPQASSQLSAVLAHCLASLSALLPEAVRARIARILITHLDHAAPLRILTTLTHVALVCSASWTNPDR